ncbi:MAG: ribonuclease HI family protein [Actinomycetota bacterium]|nr:ribonuclease HI family protein [Actinomycetota bacterium]
MRGRLLLYTDGAARGNPGPAAVGAVLYEEVDGARTCVGEVSRSIGAATNNVAEYQALIDGLALAERFRPQELVVRADSQLLVRQLLGQYKVKAPGLRALHDEAVRRLRGFATVKVEHVPREENAEADALANAALDRTEGWS